MSTSEASNRQKRHIGIGGIIVGVVATIAIEALILGVRWLESSKSPQPLPALIRDMATAVDQITPTFSDRIKARFPIGSDENELISELRSEGFEPRWNLRGEPRVAVLVRGGPACREEWRVFWRTDASDMVAVIGAEYAPICL